MSLHILISQAVTESAYASPVIHAEFIVLRNVLRLRLRRDESDPSTQSQGFEQPLWDSPVPDLLSISFMGGKMAGFLQPEEVMITSICKAASHFKNGVEIIAVFGSKVVQYLIAPDIFKLSHGEQQKDCVLRPFMDEEIAALKRLTRWPRNDSPRSWMGMGDTRGELMFMWPLFLKRTVFRELYDIVDVAADDVTGLPVWMITIEGQGTIWRMDYGCRHIVKRSAQGHHVFSHCEVDMDNDVVMTDVEDDDNRYVRQSMAVSLTIC